MKNNKVIDENGNDTGYYRRVCPCEWEQGCYFFDGRWEALKSIYENVPNIEVYAIIAHIKALVDEYNGIDFALFFDHKEKPTILVQQQMSGDKNHYDHPNNFITIMYSYEY